MPRRKQKVRPRPNDGQSHSFNQFARETAQRAFKMQAAGQRFCQHPDCENPSGPWEAHHACYQQEIERYSKDPAVVWHVDNALRLCIVCHKQNQHNRKNPVPVCALKDENIEFTARLMGPAAAYEYIKRRYAGTDQRLEALIVEHDRNPEPDVV